MDIKDCKAGLDVTYYRMTPGSGHDAMKVPARIEYASPKRVRIRLYDIYGKLTEKTQHADPELLELARARSFA